MEDPKKQESITALGAFSAEQFKNQTTDTLLSVLSYHPSKPLKLNDMPMEYVLLFYYLSEKIDNLQGITSPSDDQQVSFQKLIEEYNQKVKLEASLPNGEYEGLINSIVSCKVDSRAFVHLKSGEIFIGHVDSVTGCSRETHIMRFSCESVINLNKKKELFNGYAFIPMRDVKYITLPNVDESEGV